MYVITLLSFIICIQIFTAIASDTNDVDEKSQSNILYEVPTELINKNDEEYVYIPRSTDYASKKTRQQSSSNPLFLRFGRSQPNFLRFGRSQPTFLRFGRNANTNGGTFLRFGRQIQQSLTNNNDDIRFGKKGEFLRFG